MVLNTTIPSIPIAILGYKCPLSNQSYQAQNVIMPKGSSVSLLHAWKLLKSINTTLKRHGKNSLTSCNSIFMAVSHMNGNLTLLKRCFWDSTVWLLPEQVPERHFPL